MRQGSIAMLVPAHKEELSWWDRCGKEGEAGCGEGSG